MASAPWLTLVGLGEDGPDGLPPASAQALRDAEVVMGPPRHLDLIAALGLRADVIEWPVPFADGLAPLFAMRGRAVAVVVSGDPFWFGAGSVITRTLEPSEWRALPGPSVFSLAAARLGWPLETCHCVALHAAPFARLRPILANGRRILTTLRDGGALGDLAGYLAQIGFGRARVTAMQALGGPRETCVRFVAQDGAPVMHHPICAAIEPNQGPAMPCTTGLDDSWFDHDGQLTKAPLRALSVSALAPRPGDYLWDIGGGSGSIAIEWLLRDPTLRATSVEANAARKDRIVANAARLGVDHLQVVHGSAPGALTALAAPDAVFIGGGLSPALLETLHGLAPGTRIVANAVTLESEALLIGAQAKCGGTLLRVALSNSVPIGSKHGWSASYPIVQWSVTL